jgi:hypothetical protein
LEQDYQPAPITCTVCREKKSVLALMEKNERDIAKKKKEKMREGISWTNLKSGKK